MKTLSNIIPNPLNINKILNSNYSTSRFATSDYNGKENTDVIKNQKNNIVANRINEDNGDLYIGGIGEIGLVMQNVGLINEKITTYKGTEIPLDGKYVSSTFYNVQTQSNKEYSLGQANGVWYYDISYGMINHGTFDTPYRKLPLYKYDIKDFDSTEDDFDEFDDHQLYLGNDNNNKFNLMDYFYYCQDDTLDNLTNASTYNFFEDNDFTNIVKYPIYYKNGIYSMPLLPTYKLDNYYDCEFFVFIPQFSRYINNGTKKKQEYNINLIYKNIKLSVKFGNGEIKEILEPFTKLNDAVVYKFHKQWLFDYMFINNQEIIISLIDYGINEQSERVLVSKKVFFNLFKILFYQGRYNNYDFRFKYNNYYPLKYPLLSKKKFLELDYVPYEKIENFSEQTLVNTNMSEEVSDKDPYINLTNISNNYAYLNTYIYHNLSEGNNLIEWFIKENGNGLFVDQNINDDNFTYFDFAIENPDNKNLECFCKTFTNYDEDGILESNINITKIDSEDIQDIVPNLKKYNNFNVYGLKQLIYLPYEFDIYNVYNHNQIFFNNINGNQKVLSIFEDYIYVCNMTNNIVKLYFTDGSSTLCENTRIINIPANTCKVYKPSRHDNYNIIIKNCLLNTYKLYLYKIYKPYMNNSNRISNISQIISNINSILTNNNGNINYVNELNNYLEPISSQMLDNSNNHEIINVPIYDYSIPLFGNIILIRE